MATNSLFFPIAWGPSDTTFKLTEDASDRGE